MRHAHQPRITHIIIAAILLTGMASTSLHAGDTGAKDALPDVKASSNPCLKYLPNDWFLVANANIKAYFDAMSNAEDGGNPADAMLKQYSQLVQAFTGIDITKDIQYTTAIVSGDPDGRTDALVVIKGTFNNALVRGRLAGSVGQGMRERFYGGQTIYTGGDMAYSLPEPSTIVFGTEAAVKGAIDRTKKGPAKVPAPLKRTLDRTNGNSVVWAALQPAVFLGSKELDQWRKTYATLHKSLGPIECMSVYFDMTDDGVLANALASLPGAAEAKALGAYLTRRRNALLKTEGSNVLFCSLLVMSKVTSHDRYVKGSLRLTGKAVTELWNTNVIVKPKP